MGLFFQEAMEFFRDNLAAACENLEKLQKQAGLEVSYDCWLSNNLVPFK